MAAAGRSFAFLALVVFAALASAAHAQPDYGTHVMEDGTVVDRDFLEHHPMLKSLAGRSHFPNEPTKDMRYYNTSTYTQKLDHFNPLDTRTFEQRVTVVDEFYAPGNPVFIFLDGEAPMEFFGFQEVSAIYWAQQFGALYISLEHRYYGESLPFTRFSAANMTYLSSQQALADAAQFIQDFSKDIDNPGPWVVFGCSYSGGLSAWFRLKYPQLVLASVAPSGPVFANSNFTSYYGQFETSCQLAGLDDCVTAVESGVAQITEMLQTTDGIDQLQTIFNTCTPIEPSEAWFFELTLMGNVGGADQMDNPPDWPLNQTCNIMTSSTDYVQNWADTFPDGCVSISQESWLNFMKLEIPNSNRSWFWQKCTEFGYFKPSYPGTSVFFDDVYVEPMIEWCEQIFGIEGMTPDTEWTNTYYGGYDLHASNVMFTNGLLDPWHNLSIYEDEGEVQAVTYLAGHCATMDAPNPTDPPSLTQARKEVKQFLADVLSMTPKSG